MFRTVSYQHLRKIRANRRPGDLPKSVLRSKESYLSFFSRKSYSRRKALLKKFRNKWLRQNHKWF